MDSTPIQRIRGYLALKGVVGSVVIQAINGPGGLVFQRHIGLAEETERALAVRSRRLSVSGARAGVPGV